jgi:DNA-binding transcriptional regulator YiaG
VNTGNVKMLEETYGLKTEEFIKVMGVSKNMMQVQLNRTGTK